MAHDHQHSAAGAHRGRLALVFAITVAVLLVEVAGAAISGSLALLADAGHMLTDVAGIGLALLAIRFAARPATPQRTFGYYRLEILAAVVNAVLLFGVAGGA
jgi:cobalt-zinc-cadmium efflux system protein